MPKIFESAVPLTLHRVSAKIRGGRAVPIAYTMFKTFDGEHHSNWWIDCETDDEGRRLIDPELDKLSHELTAEDEFFIWTAVMADMTQ